MYKDFKKSESLDTDFVGGNGIIWMFSGIVLGLMVGIGMYYFSSDRGSSVSLVERVQQKIEKVQSQQPLQTGNTSTLDKYGSQKLAQAKQPPPQVEKRKEKFSYYAVLPTLNVPVGNAKPLDTRPAASQQPLAQQINTTEVVANQTEAVIEAEQEVVESEAVKVGDYLLQVASFKKESMADKTRGRLTNRGIDAYIQKKKVKGRYWYRVVAGPVDQASVDDWKQTAESLGHRPLVISVR